MKSVRETETSDLSLELAVKSRYAYKTLILITVGGGTFFGRVTPLTAGHLDLGLGVGPLSTSSRGNYPERTLVPDFIDPGGMKGLVNPRAWTGFEPVRSWRLARHHPKHPPVRE